MSALVLSDALVIALKKLSVEFVFGMGGANIEHFYDAIFRLGDKKLQAILARNESAAAFMADGLARAHNKLGVCCATSGGAMINLAAGISEAYADNVPILAIVGQPPSKLEGKGAFQDSSGQNNTVDGIKFWQAISGYVAKITHNEQFWPCLSAALTVLTEQKKPAILLIPRQIFTIAVPPMPVDFLAFTKKKLLSNSAKLQIRQLATMLTDSPANLLIVGKYAKYYNLQQDIKKLVEWTNSYVASSFGDINSFNQNSHYYIGAVGVGGHQAAFKFIESAAKVLLVIEDDYSIMSSAGINRKTDSKLVYVGVNASKAIAAAEFDLVIEAPADLIISDLLTHIGGQASTNNSLTFNKFSPATATSDSRLYANDQVIDNPSQLVTTLEQYLPKIKYIFFDAGNCVATIMHHLKLPAHVKTFVALGMGGMGYAIPAAIGAKIAAKDTDKVIVLIGDGGFLISGLEIHTAITLKLPILFIVLNNNMHGMCVTRQEIYFAGRINAATYSPFQAAKVVEGLDYEEQLWSATINSIGNLADKLAEYYQNYAHKTGLLEIKINRNPVPPFIPFKNPN